jgi:hypothetical protein
MSSASLANTTSNTSSRNILRKVRFPKHRTHNPTPTSVFPISRHPKPANSFHLDGSRARPYDTVSPLADSLGLKIDASVSRDDAEGAAKTAKAYEGPGNVLICWEHGRLAGIAEALGVKRYAAASGASGKVNYPGDRFDLIWTIRNPYEEIESVTSEDIPGLDDGHKDP